MKSTESSVQRGCCALGCEGSELATVGRCACHSEQGSCGQRVRKGGAASWPWIGVVGVGAPLRGDFSEAELHWCVGYSIPSWEAGQESSTQ